MELIHMCARSGLAKQKLRPTAYTHVNSTQPKRNMQTTTLRATALASSTRTNSSETLLVRHRYPPLEYLRKMLLYSLLCLLARALAANPCFGFAMQYCQLRMPSALVLFAKWSRPSEALFFSFI
ncbi:hypothetical protein Pcac1_g3254 [Phytophthora cactorum]|nr:hypothetical protein Pcac1_g3254 [Phytophthora cactorum]KAG2890719.1 hypothetical protein PC114_g17311 [Phytophthora cactorum]KAG2919776.1 hypothetical protein PC117_g16688 [Phytophthora cactorum]KAG3008358.1 hypothetical protein PC120_g16283 [Phytophthora cactorum]